MVASKDLNGDCQFCLCLGAFKNRIGVGGVDRFVFFEGVVLKD